MASLEVRVYAGPRFTLSSIGDSLTISDLKEQVMARIKDSVTAAGPSAYAKFRIALESGCGDELLQEMQLVYPAAGKILRGGKTVGDYALPNGTIVVHAIMKSIRFMETPPGTTTAVSTSTAQASATAQAATSAPNSVNSTSGQASLPPPGAPVSVEEITRILERMQGDPAFANEVMARAAQDHSFANMMLQQTSRNPQQMNMVMNLMRSNPQVLSQAQNLMANDPTGAMQVGYNAAAQQQQGSAAPAADTRPPRERFANQLSELADMGFGDDEAAVQALVRANGDLGTAIDFLAG